MRKLYSSFKGRAAKAVDRQGWTKRESMVALISVIVSTIGVVISAGSSIIAWQQVEMLRNERMTPYRAIMFNSKVESYGDIANAIGEMDEQVQKFMSITRPSYLSGETQRKARLEVSLETLTLLSRIRARMASASVLWPEEIGKKMSAFYIVQLESCADQIAMLNGLMNGPKFIPDICDRNKIYEDTSETMRYGVGLLAEMRQNLNADRLQSIN